MLSNWSDSLLELVLERLSLADLARCSKVCHQWCRVASDSRLRARALLRCLPPWQKNTMLQAAACSQQILTLWCDRLAEGSPARQALESQLAQRLSPVAISYVLLQHRLGTGQFDPDSLHRLTFRDFRLRDLVISPDGQYLACTTRPDDGWVSDSLCLQIYRYDAGQWQPAGQFDCSSYFYGLMFRDDSRTLQCVDGTGRLHQWQESAGRWQSAGSQLLCEGPRPGICRPVRTAAIWPLPQKMAISPCFMSKSGRSLGQPIQPGGGTSTGGQLPDPCASL